MKEALSGIWILTLLVSSIILLAWGVCVGLFEKEWAKGTFLVVLSLSAQFNAERSLKRWKEQHSN